MLQRLRTKSSKLQPLNSLDMPVIIAQSDT